MIQEKTVVSCIVQDIPAYGLMSHRVIVRKKSHKRSFKESVTHSHVVADGHSARHLQLHCGPDRGGLGGRRRPLERVVVIWVGHIFSTEGGGTLQM